VRYYTKADPCLVPLLVVARILLIRLGIPPDGLDVHPTHRRDNIRIPHAHHQSNDAIRDDPGRFPVPLYLPQGVGDPQVVNHSKRFSIASSSSEQWADH